MNAESAKKTTDSINDNRKQIEDTTTTYCKCCNLTFENNKVHVHGKFNCQKKLCDVVVDINRYSIIK